MMNLFMFLAICFVAYFLFRNLNLNLNLKEGMTDASGNTNTAASSVPNGVAGNADSYGATIKAASIKLHDVFLISKYRSNYENVILNLDDLVNCLMLEAALNVNINKPQEALSKLADLNQTKNALNNVMKFVDNSS